MGGSLKKNPTLNQHPNKLQRKKEHGRGNRRTRGRATAQAHRRVCTISVFYARYYFVLFFSVTPVSYIVFRRLSLPRYARMSLPCHFLFFSRPVSIILLRILSSRLLGSVTSNLAPSLSRSGPVFPACCPSRREIRASRGDAARSKSRLLYFLCVCAPFYRI